jgi:hypothetical protein
MLVNEYKLYVSIQKSSKNAKFGKCLLRARFLALLPNAKPAIS